MDKIWNKAIELGEELSNEMYKKNSLPCIGRVETVEFEVDGKNYKAKIKAHWENVNHFDCTVNGIDNYYKKYECCNKF